MKDLSSFKHHKIADKVNGVTVEYETQCNNVMLNALVSSMFDKGITKIELLDGLIVIDTVGLKPARALKGKIAPKPEPVKAEPTMLEKSIAAEKKAPEDELFDRKVMGIIFHAIGMNRDNARRGMPWWFNNDKHRNHYCVEPGFDSNHPYCEQLVKLGFMSRGEIRGVLHYFHVTELGIALAIARFYKS